MKNLGQKKQVKMAKCLSCDGNMFLLLIEAQNLRVLECAGCGKRVGL